MMTMNNRESITIEHLVIRLAQILAFVPVVNVLLGTPYILGVGMQDPQLVGLIQTWFYFIVSLPITIGFGIFKSKGALIYGIVWNFIFLTTTLRFSFDSCPISGFVHPLYFFSEDAVRYLFLSIYVVSIIVYFISFKVLSKTNTSTEAVQVP